MDHRRVGVLAEPLCIKVHRNRPIQVQFLDFFELVCSLPNALKDCGESQIRLTWSAYLDGLKIVALGMRAVMASNSNVGGNVIMALLSSSRTWAPSLYKSSGFFERP